MPQPRHPLAERLADLEAKAAGDFHQLETAPVTALCNVFQRFADGGIVRALMFLEEFCELGDAQRFTRGKHCTLDNLDQTCL